MYFFETSQNKRYAQVACAVLWCLFGAGPIFGFAALKPTLIDQGIYEDLCLTNKTIEISTLSTLFNNLSLTPLNFETEGFISKCTNQDLKLNMMFTVGAALTNVSALIIGRTLDFYGPRICGLIGALFLLLASLVFINSNYLLNFFDPYLIGYSLMALGGPFAYISSFQLSNAFPEKSGLILALLTGAFDTSSAVFLIYKKLYLSYPLFFKLQTFYKFYLIIPIFIIIAQFLIMPNESYLTPPPELIPNPTDEQRALSIAAAQEDFIHESIDQNNFNENDETPLINTRRRSSLGDAYKSVYIEEEVEDATKSKTELSYSIFGILHGYSINHQFNSWWFKLICLFSTIQMLRLNYFVATVNSQYTYLLGSYEKANSLNKLFDIALPLGGVISIPFVGLFLDHFSTSVVLTVLLIVSLLIGILGIIKNSLISGIINVLIFVAYRPFFYTSISDYCAKVFGFETFGTIYGSIMTVAGFVNFLQSILDKLTHTYFKMNPIPLNILLLAITIIIGTATVSYVTIETHKYALLRLKGNEEIENELEN